MDFKKIGKIIYWVVLIVLVVIAGATAFSVLNIPGNYKMFVVQSGSMEPVIKTGSIVVVKPTQDYQKGDVVTFRDLEKPKVTVTHRIFEVSKENNSTKFITKGDANKTADSTEISKGQILGKVFLSIPFLGYPVDFAKTQTGLIVLIIIPAVIIVYSELQNIKKEALRLIQERKTRKLTTAEEFEEKVGEEVIKVEKKVKKALKKK